MPNRIALVPPTLPVLARLIASHIDVSYAVTKLVDRCYMGFSYQQLHSSGLPRCKIATDTLGHGLTIGYTETGWAENGCLRGLIWIAELSCHPFCSFFPRECQGEMTAKAWLEKIEKKHLEWLDRLPRDSTY